MSLVRRSGTGMRLVCSLFNAIQKAVDSGLKGGRRGDHCYACRSEGCVVFLHAQTRAKDKSSCSSRCSSYGLGV